MDIYNKTLDIDWKIINLIGSIERFDACWPAIKKREGSNLISLIKEGDSRDEVLLSYIDRSQDLHFWNETDIDTHIIVKCAILCAEINSINTKSASVGLPVLLLKKSGYGWTDFINVSKAFENELAMYSQLIQDYNPKKHGENVTQWVTFFLNCINQALNAFMQALDLNGVESHLSSKEKQLLHIIGSRSATKTAGIAQKLGVSNSTSKRMLDRLLNANLIKRHGIGPGSYYTIM